MRIDLNSDLGESSAAAQLEIDARLLDIVTSVNIACGFHAGNPELMRRTVVLARDKGVAVGAHPGLRDQGGLGRRERTVSVAEAEESVAAQIGALTEIAAHEGVRLQHVKPHGALYNMAARDIDLAVAIARATAESDRNLILVGLAGSRLIEAGRSLGLRVAEEAFADRAYIADGTLVSRDQPGALIVDEEEVTRRVVSLAKEGTVASRDCGMLAIHADTICVHGDTEGAERLASAIRHALTGAGIRIVPVGQPNA